MWKEAVGVAQMEITTTIEGKQKDRKQNKWGPNVSPV
jgi:hypothetical protein